MLPTQCPNPAGVMLPFTAVAVMVWPWGAPECIASPLLLSPSPSCPVLKAFSGEEKEKLL